MQEITYHQATENQATIIIDNVIAFAREYNGSIDAQLEEQLRANQLIYFADALRNKTFIAWYAMCGSEVAGIGGICIRQQPPTIKNLSGKTGYVFSMYTNANYRRRGICNNLLNRLLETAKEMGVTGFELHATKDGEPIYVKNGFVQFQEPTYRKYVSVSSE